jgi:hypothetical protein
MIGDVLVTQGQADDALADQGAERMHDPAGIAAVPEARGNPVNQADCPIRLPQQQRPGIRRRARKRTRNASTPPPRGGHQTLRN